VRAWQSGAAAVFAAAGVLEVRGTGGLGRCGHRLGRGDQRARFPGKISAVNKGPVTAQVTVTADAGVEITASMTGAAAEWVPLSLLPRLPRSNAMQASARNRFPGTIAAVNKGPATTQVTLTVGGGVEITASMTTAAAERLGVATGQQAVALVKASEVVLITDFAGYKLSARNQLAGTVSRVQRGAVTSLVGVELPGGTVVTASVTNDAVDSLGLAVGQTATAAFKAYAVMVAVKS
jgi:molybdate transport system regulatory protein